MQLHATQCKSLNVPMPVFTIKIAVGNEHIKIGMDWISPRSPQDGGLVWSGVKGLEQFGTLKPKCVTGWDGVDPWTACFLLADRKQQGNGCCPGGIHGGWSRGHSLKSEWAEEHPDFCKRQLADSRNWILRSSGYKHCHERPKFNFMVVDGLLSQRSHLFGQLVEAGRKRVLYSNMVKLVSYHQELNEHDYILYRLQSRWRRGKRCLITFCQISSCKILEKLNFGSKILHSTVTT